MISLLTAVAFIFIPSQGAGRSSSDFPYKLKCFQVKDYLECQRYYPEENKGDRPIYHCGFTAYSHVQRGSCTDGKGSFKSKERNSGPHPRDRNLL